ncbi:phosphotransferase family protein [Nocardioides kongjuensis]|uniref:Aminoglycoside phosphotransferase (APT) family kinase protein n=1 Tax=Nocardioides kongjuensis TaxID=349522 RepID=A0A852RHT0_9ACTN|nr:phosphotransferase family protein [Nocardioides kongjuensis]NYD28896.1 aminoglycoside phosphotransferase (APT) family kinase protein [Nocardioides kongjuensis]
MSELTAAELAAVADRLDLAGVSTAGPLTSDLIAGGRSNLTYAITDGRTRWVLRTPPRAGRTASAHDVAREHRVTAALMSSGVPVADAVLLCEDEAVLGVPFTVSGFVDGVAIRTQADLASYDDDRLATVVDSLLETLAALHGVDHVAAGLETFGRPDGYAARQLRRWSGQWDTVGEERLDGLAREVVARLTAALPEQRATAVVHGDYRVDNTLLAPPGTARADRVAAVVDWELSTIGDPVADVAMMCAYRHPPFDLVVGAPSAWTSPRLPSVDDLATGYERVGGVALEHWDFHRALACFKVAVISAGIDHRRLAGSGSGTGFDTAGEAVEPYLEQAARLVR